MATLLRSLISRLDTDNSRWLRGMDQASNSVVAFERNVTRRFNNVARAVSSLNVLVGGAAVAGLTALLSRFTNTADEAGKFARRIGETTENLSRLQFVAERSGLSVETLNSSLQRQTNRLGLAIEGSTKYAEALSDIGLSVQEITGLSPAEAFLAIAEGMRQLEDSTVRVRVAQELWGREGTALLQIVDQTAEEVERLMMRSDELGRTLSSDTAQAAAEFNDALTDLQSSLTGLANNFLPIVLRPLSVMIDLFTNAIIQIRSFIRWVGELADSLARGLSDNAFVDALSVFFPNIANIIRGVTLWSEAQKEINRDLDDTVRVVNDTATAVGLFDDNVKPMVINVNKAEAALEDYRRSLDRQTDSADLAAQKAEALRDWFDSLSVIEKAEQWEFFIRELERLGVTFEAEVMEPISAWETAVQDALSSLADNFAFFWDELISGSGNAFDALKRAALSVLEEIISNYSSAKITDLLGGLFGGGGGPGGQAGGGLTQLLGNLAGPLGTILGTGIGALAGGFIDNIFGGENRIKESQIFLGNTPNRFVTPASTSLQSPFGSFLSFGFSRLGNEGQLSDQEALRILENLESASRLIIGVDELITSTLSSTQISNINQILESLPRQSVNFGPGVIDSFIRERFNIIFTAVDESLGSVFDEFSAVHEGDALIQFVQDIAGLNAVFEDGQQVFSDVSTVAETVNRLMEDFVGHGEALSEVLARINAANGILGALGLEGGTAAGARFNLSVLEAAGNDISRLQDLVTNFVDTFFTELEAANRLERQLGETVSGLLERLGTTRAGFTEDFTSRLEEGILTPQDVVVWLEAGQALSALLDLEEELTVLRRNAAIEANREQLDAIDAQISALEASSSAIEQQIVAQERYREQIDAVSAAIEESFGRTIEQIQLAVLDEAAQIAFLTEQLTALEASLGTVTDPARLQEILDEINAKTLQVFNLLSPEEQARFSDAFIEQLNRVLESGQVRLDELNEQSLEREQTLQNEQRAAQEEIARRMQEAAAIQESASSNFSAAVVDFRNAIQNQTINVTVGLPDNVVGT